MPVNKVPVFELRERMYHFPQRKDLESKNSYPAALKLDTGNRGLFPTGIVTRYHPRIYYVWRVELFDPESDLKLMDYYTVPTTLTTLDSLHVQSWDPRVSPARYKNWLVST